MFLAAGCATGPRLGASNELPAFYQVEDGFYRGGQPSPEGLRRLAQMGVKTVISLRHRSHAMDWERTLTEQLGMRWVNIPIYYFWRPTEVQIRQFLALVTDPANRPAFVHCRLGQNRAGIMVAIYRIAHQGWTPQQAYAEGRRFGLVPWNPMSRYCLFREVPHRFVVLKSRQ